MGSRGAPSRCERPERGEEFVRVLLDGLDLVVVEEVGEETHRHLPVLQHVGDAGRGAQVVFQNVEGVGIHPHHVDPADGGVDAVRHLHAEHLGPVVGVLVDQFGRDQPGLQDLTVVVDVGEEEVERLDALFEALGELAPFLAGDDPRHDVERDDPLLGIVLAVDGEGDADAAEQHFRFPGAGAQLVWR